MMWWVRCGVVVAMVLWKESESELLMFFCFVLFGGEDVDVRMTLSEVGEWEVGIWDLGSGIWHACCLCIRMSAEHAWKEMVYV
jgi:hypothetical protein